MAARQQTARGLAGGSPVSPTATEALVETSPDVPNLAALATAYAHHGSLLNAEGVRGLLRSGYA